MKRKICDCLGSVDQARQKNRSRFWLRFFWTNFSTSEVICVTNSQITSPFHDFSFIPLMVFLAYDQELHIGELSQ